MDAREIITLSAILDLTCKNIDVRIDMKQKNAHFAGILQVSKNSLVKYCREFKKSISDQTD